MRKQPLKNPDFIVCLQIWTQITYGSKDTVLCCQLLNIDIGQIQILISFYYFFGS